VTRALKAAKSAGAWFEGLIAKYLADRLADDRIERRRLMGANDRGDIAGLRVHGQRVVVECKEYGGRYDIGTWLGEAERERINDEALAAFVVAKRRATRSPEHQVVIMTMRDLTALLTGTRE
jgi:hypothetical protein